MAETGAGLVAPFRIDVATRGMQNLNEFRRRVDGLSTAGRNWKSVLTSLIGGMTGFVGVVDGGAVAGLALRNAIVGLTRGFKDLIFENARAADEIAKTARGLGLTAQTFQELQYSLSIFGVQTAGLIRSLTAFSFAITGARDGLSSYQRAFRSVGCQNHG